MPRQRTMKMMRATRPFRYDHRMMMAGDTFEVDARFVRVLRATRKAVEVREKAVVPPPPPEVQAKIEAAIAASPVAEVHENVEQPVGAMSVAESGLVADDMAALRAEYFAVLGKQPFRGWDATVLRSKIAAAK